MNPIIQSFETETIVAGVTVATFVASLIGLYIKYRNDKGAIDFKFEAMDKRLEDMECDLQEHIRENAEQAEQNRIENREDHQMIYAKLDEIKNYLIQGKFR